VTTFETQQLLGWIGRAAVDAKGKLLGTVDAIYEDDSGSGPEWFAITAGDDTRPMYVPVRGATADGDRLRVPYSKSHISRAPVAGADVHLSPEQVTQLYRHYGMEWAFHRASGTRTTDPGPTDDTALDGEARDDDGAMTRSEEELRVTTREREAGRAHLRKWVETEMVQVTVPVRREYARLVTEPASGDDSGDIGEIDSDGEVVLLREEEIVIEKRVVQRENVRLEVDTVIEERVVSEEVRKERIALEGDVTQE
jgi:uncharacterized protein (TIGR02271 family)